MGKLRVLIVDDDADMRSLLRNLIEMTDEGLSAADGDEALRRWRETPRSRADGPGDAR